MLFNILKFFHILFVITAVGSNITYGVWQARAGNDPQHESFVLRGVKFLDDWVANPAYLLVLVTGLAMAWWHWSYTTHWIAAAIVLYVIMLLSGLAVYSPALTRQIETPGARRSAIVRLPDRGHPGDHFWHSVMVPILTILFLMVTKPSLG